MSARDSMDESALIESELAALEAVRDLMEDVDISTAAGEDYVRQLLHERGLPGFLIYAVKRQPVTDAAMQWAKQRLSELRASGDVA